MGGGGGGGGGFFSNPIQNIGSAVGYVAGGIPGAVAGTLAGNVMGSHGQESPPPPGMDPALAQLRDQRIKEANTFRDNIPGATQDMNRDLDVASGRNLQKDISNNNTSFNRRGLLGSGMNQGANAGAQASEGLNLAKNKENMANQMQDQADQMQQAAVNNGYQYWQSSKAIQDSAYNAALSNMTAARSGTTALVGAAFKGGGAALGAA